MSETLASLHRNVRDSFRAARIETADMDAKILVLEVLGLDLTDLVTRGDQPLDAAQSDLIAACAARRLAGEPVHRILGRRSFYGLDLELSADTLEPRPDTEVLVEALVPRLATRNPCRILDLGTGTGALALALLSALPNATALATDISAGALETAARNAGNLGLANRFMIACGDWFQPISGQYDAIVSNPPYIKSDAIAGLAREVRCHDPMRALDGGPDGLEAYRSIANGANDFLAVSGLVAVEIGYDQKESVTALFQDAGYERLDAVKDFGGNDRALIFARKGDKLRP